MDEKTIQQKRNKYQVKMANAHTLTQIAHEHHRASESAGTAMQPAQRIYKICKRIVSVILTIDCAMQSS